MNDHVIAMHHVTKTFGKKVAVDDLSLLVPAQSIYGFIGPNGSGKTTTMRMIMNILYPDRGAITVFGKSVFGRPPDDIGYLPEERGLYKKMKVRELLEFLGGLKSNRNVAREVDEWLVRLQLAACANQKLETLSKGMSQKVQFIAAVVTRPPLLVLDEPFSGLDPVNLEVIRQAILELRAQGTTVILSTHDMALAENMCDYICMIFRGKKVLDSTLDRIQSAYGHDTVRLRCEAGTAALHDLPGVTAVQDLGQLQELQLAPGCDPQVILKTILGRTAVYRFDLTRPSLHAIFVRIAGPEAQEVGHA